ncbi:MAG: hypothetical protein KC503_00745, partial [Myxococcales bacterium]|nr:hypothetical protein [Myxococcales bacterium]
MTAPKNQKRLLLFALVGLTVVGAALFAVPYDRELARELTATALVRQVAAAMPLPQPSARPVARELRLRV